MKGFRVQRAAGGGHAVNIREELYVPGWNGGTAFCAITSNLEDPPEYFETATLAEMSPEMREDLLAVASGGELPERDYNIGVIGRVELEEAELTELQSQIARSKPRWKTPEELGGAIFASITRDVAA